MHDMHDLIVVGIPLIAILAGILFNRTDVKELRAEMRDGFVRVHADIAALRSEVHADIAVLQSDMRQFYHLTGKLEARMDAIEKR